jgi:ABC-2 type transport system ATP-binding protein
MSESIFSRRWSICLWLRYIVFFITAFIRFLWQKKTIMEAFPQLSIRNISMTYPNGVRALNNISLTIPPGMYGLLGPNGAGKSTLMRILATLQRPDSGEVYLGNMNTIEQSEELRKSLGYLPQDFGLLPNVTAEKLLDHFAMLKGIIGKSSRRMLVGELLHKTNLWEKRKHNLGGFSGGMRQRFGIAVALIGDPKLMIVDEPTAGLDPAERVRFLNLLSELGENSAVILSTHIVEDVYELCSRMAIINKGEILMEGVPLAAVYEMQGKIWRRLVEKKNFDQMQQDYQVVSSKLLAGKTMLNIYSDESPGNGFDLAEPGLEEVYFATIAGYNSKAKNNAI